MTGVTRQGTAVFFTPIPCVWTTLQHTVLAAEPVKTYWQCCKGEVALDEVCPVAVIIAGVLPHADSNTLVKDLLLVLQAPATGTWLCISTDLVLL